MKIGVIGLGTVGYGVIEILTNEKTRLEKEMKQEMLFQIQTEQKNSLNRWIEYFCSDDAMYPMWFKNYAFEGMLKLGVFDKEKKEFQKRNISLEQPQMKTLGIINQDGIYTNLGLLLSDQCVHTIKTAVFEGKNQNIFKDRKEFTGSLFAQMEAVYDYIDFRNQTHSTFEKLYRIDNRDYPEVAVREALLNCLVHRDYGYSSSILISMYEDRLEFTSIGGLVTGVMLEDVMMGISVCRNSKLANIFYRLELIEAYGTGIQKIMNAYQDQIIKPEIKVSNNVFKIILPNTNAQCELREELQYYTEPEDEETQIMQMIDQEKRIQRKQKNASDKKTDDFSGFCLQPESENEGGRHYC